jgi:hypothetical protein
MEVTMQPHRAAASMALPVAGSDVERALVGAQIAGLGELLATICSAVPITA